jgi:hypothetical protein
VDIQNKSSAYGVEVTIINVEAFRIINLNRRERNHSIVDFGSVISILLSDSVW